MAPAHIATTFKGYNMAEKKPGSPGQRGNKGKQRAKKIAKDELSHFIRFEQEQRRISQEMLKNPSPEDQRTFTIPFTPNDENSVHVGINGLTCSLARGEEHTMHKAFYDLLVETGHIGGREFEQHTVAGRRNRGIEKQKFERGNGDEDPAELQETQGLI